MLSCADMRGSARRKRLGSGPEIGQAGIKDLCHPTWTSPEDKHLQNITFFDVFMVLLACAFVFVIVRLPTRPRNPRAPNQSGQSGGVFVPGDGGDGGCGGGGGD